MLKYVYTNYNLVGILTIAGGNTISIGIFKGLITFQILQHNIFLKYIHKVNSRALTSQQEGCRRSTDMSYITL